MQFLITNDDGFDAPGLAALYQALTVNLTDVNEFGISSVSDTNAAVNTVLENAANGTLVGLTAFASDADGTDLITYSLANSAGGRAVYN